MNNYFRYLNQKCPICNEEFTGDEDIVVCPICGTPHHRDCYKKNGECGNYDKHQDGFRWEPETTTIPPVEAPVAEQEGAPNQNNIPYGVPPVQSSVYFGGQPSPFSLFPKEIADDVETEEVADFVQASSFKYVQKFFYVKSNKRTFNWGAFLLGPFWLFYRKMYKLGIIFLSLFMFVTIASSVPSSVQEFTNDMTQFEMKYENLGSTSEDAETLANEMSSDFKNVFIQNKLGCAIMLSYSIFYIGLHLFLGFKADKMYYNYTITKIKNIKAEIQDINQRKLAYFNRGGVAVGYTIVAVVVNSLLPSIVLEIIYAIFK